MMALPCPKCGSQHTEVAKGVRYVHDADRVLRPEHCIDCGANWYVEMKVMEESKICFDVRI